jgi:hypothetical protein
VLRTLPTGQRKLQKKLAADFGAQPLAAQLAQHSRLHSRLHVLLHPVPLRFDALPPSRGFGAKRKEKT